MKEDLYARLMRRYLALDIHKHYRIVAGVDFDGDVVLEPRWIEHGALEVWLEKEIEPSDHVVIESTTNAWHIYDLLEPLAEKVLVANPIKVKQIAQAREDGSSGHADPGAPAGGESGPVDLGAACACP